MTAVELNDLVEKLSPLADMIARTFAKSAPHLREDFLSDASFATFRVLRSPAAAQLGANLAALVRVAARNACLDRLKYEARRPTVQFDTSAGEERDPLALIPGREPEPGVELEATEEVAKLVHGGGLTKSLQAKISRILGLDALTNHRQELDTGSDRS